MHKTDNLKLCIMYENNKRSYKSLDMIRKRCYNTYKRTNKSRKTKLYELFRGGFK